MKKYPHHKGSQHSKRNFVLISKGQLPVISFTSDETELLLMILDFLIDVRDEHPADDSMLTIKEISLTAEATQHKLMHMRQGHMAILQNQDYAVFYAAILYFLHVKFLMPDFLPTHLADQSIQGRILALEKKISPALQGRIAKGRNTASRKMRRR